MTRNLVKMAALAALGQVLILAHASSAIEEKLVQVSYSLFARIV